MEASSFRRVSYIPPPADFAVEMPSQPRDGESENGVAYTGFRHLMSEQQQHQRYSVGTYQAPFDFRPFSITTNNISLGSGFPYTQGLHDLGITPEQWLQFSREVVNATKLTKAEDKAAWTAGVATSAAAFPFIMVFGPVVGYYAGKSVHKKTLVKKVKEKLAKEGDLRSTLREWNEGLFRERGIQVKLEPPTLEGEVVIDARPGASPREMQKEARRLARRFRIVLVPFDPRMHDEGPWWLDDGPGSPLSSLSLRRGGTSELASPVSALSRAASTSIPERGGWVDQKANAARASPFSGITSHPLLVAEIQGRPAAVEMNGGPPAAAEMNGGSSPYDLPPVYVHELEGSPVARELAADKAEEEVVNNADQQLIA